MSKTKICAMLVQYDKTVPNALELFETVKNLDVDCWGFKDIGLPREDLLKLGKMMKETGKPLNMEIMTDTEDEWVESAIFAHEAGVENCMGGYYSKKVMDKCHELGMKYYPFIGRLEGNPHMLQGTPEEIIGLAKEAIDAGCDGICVPVYRFVGNIPELMKALNDNIDVPVCLAGSINSKERIDESIKYGISQLNIGSSFFTGDFAPNKGIAENIEQAMAWSKEND